MNKTELQFVFAPQKSELNITNCYVPAAIPDSRLVIAFEFA